MMFWLESVQLQLSMILAARPDPQIAQLLGIKL